jgi:uncharacterized protein YecE (DUF72 family)
VAGPGEILVGCCGFALPQARYFRRFDLLEVQQSFYEPPRVETARRWRQKAPQGFTFTLKAWQLITHEPSSPTYRRLRTPILPPDRPALGSFRPTSQVLAAWERTRELARALDAALVLFQCPASFGPTALNIRNMREFFRSIPRDGLSMAWEPRGEWPQELVRSLCQELHLIHCVDPFRGAPLWGEINYFRLHGITGYDYRYTDEDLVSLFSCCAEKMSYVLFNNLPMAEDAMRFQILVNSKARPLPG